MFTKDGGINKSEAVGLEKVPSQQSDGEIKESKDNEKKKEDEI